MKADKGLTDARARFQQIDADVGSLSVRLEEAHAKRVQAGLDVAAIDREIESFTTSGEFDSKAGAKLLSRQTEASTFLTLMERSIEHLTRELAAAKVAVLNAEREANAATLQFHSAHADKLIREFLRSNAKTLQEIVRSMGVVNQCSNVDAVGIEEARRYGYNVETLFERVIPDAVVAEFRYDEAFFEGCVVQSSTSAAQIHYCEHVTPTERTYAKNAAPNDVAKIAAIVKASEPKTPAPFDSAFAFNSAREAAKSAEHHRQRAAGYKEKLARVGEKFSTHPKGEVASIQKEIEYHNKEADRYDSIVAKWDDAIQAHRMAA